MKKKSGGKEQIPGVGGELSLRKKPWTCSLKTCKIKGSLNFCYQAMHLVVGIWQSLLKRSSGWDDSTQNAWEER